MWWTGGSTHQRCSAPQANSSHGRDPSRQGSDGKRPFLIAIIQHNTKNNGQTYTRSDTPRLQERQETEGRTQPANPSPETSGRNSNRGKDFESIYLLRGHPLECRSSRVIL